MAQAAEKIEETLPVPGTAESLPAFLQEHLDEDAGKGLSTAQDDNIVPLVYVLDAKSPQVNERGGDYVDGARAGDIWLRNSSAPIVEGEVGFLFQPCHFQKVWIEWIPRSEGGGFVARHTVQPPAAELRSVEDDRGNTVTRLLMPNGNEVRETREHAGFVLGRGSPQPYVIPFTSTGLTVSREWMTRMNNYTHKGKALPGWSRVYRLKTKMRKNKKGEWFTLTFEDTGSDDGYPGGWMVNEDYDRGKRLNAAFEGGTQRTEAPAQPGSQAAMEDKDIPF